MQKWIFKEFDRNEVIDFAKKHSMSPVVAVTFINRGINTDEKYNEYVKKSLAAVINPMLMSDMEPACERIRLAIENKEKITIFGDYDADGVTSTSILYLFLKKQGANVDYYIPDRFSEGYGLNIMAVNKLSKSGTKLLITVDCGITSTGEVQLAKAQGMDVIITDHHTVGEKIPEALVVHPKREDSQYPFKELAGVGVAFKLVLGLGMTLGLKSSDVFKDYIDLVSVGTIADIVPLLGENRVIVSKGVEKLRVTDNFGLKALFEVSGVKPESMNAMSVAFGISPRINAAGRLSNAKDAVELLTAESYNEGYQKALQLDELNKKRQEIEQNIAKQAFEMLERDCNLEKKKVIVLSGEGWHHGVIGIVASRILEKYYKPCIMISSENGIGIGSARSIPGFNIYDALSHCSDLLTKFGGHSQAAGLSLAMNDFDDFSKKINKYADGIIDDDMLTRRLLIDCKVRTSDVTMDNAERLLELEPFGQENERPVYAIYHLKVVSVSAMGQEGKHLRMCVSDQSNLINCVGFGMGQYAGKIEKGQYCDIAFHMNINEFNGNKNVQALLKDIRIY